MIYFIINLVLFNVIFVLILMYTLLLCPVICIFIGIMFFFLICEQEICGKVEEFSFSTVQK